jgi:4-diphosphocytidyl-2-C-methyl-D-erythritol kinase
LQAFVPLPDGRARLTEAAPAKINLTLRILGRRADGYHELESLVVFARLRDHLTLLPGRPLSLDVHGPTAAAAGVENNLVLKAAKALGARVMGLQAGRFLLEKSLPVAAGIGGGSADAAAALRLLARANGIAPDDPLLYAAARVTGADVPVCVHPVPRIMRGIGDVLSEPLPLPELPAVLVNPGVPAATKEVFAALARGGYPAGASATNWDALPPDHTGLVEFLRSERNDLEPPATTLYPAISQVLAALRSAKGCRLARMSGSGSTCFGLFDTSKAAEIAARLLQAPNPTWWVRATVLGAGSAPP